MIQEGQKQIKNIIEATGIKSGTFLDIGCGAGHVSYTAASEGFYSIGLDPDKKRFRFNNNYVVAIGEYLPFKDNSFNLISSLSVLEHCQDWRMSIKEMMRILQKNGKIYIYFPNSLYPYEHHYNIFFLPIHKQLARGYLLTFRQKNVNYINSLQYIYTLKIKKLFIKLGGNITDLQTKRRNPLRKLVARLGLLNGAWLVITKC